MPTASLQTKSKRQRHDRCLLLIAVYKFLHALIFIAIGFGAHRLLHKDIADQIELLARYLRFNPESHLVNFILDESLAPQRSPPAPHRLRRLRLRGITLAEGIGLYLEKAWGEFLTLAITASFLPLEIFEVVRRLTWIRAGLLIINAVVFIYLLQLVLGNARRRAKARKK